MQPDDAPWQGDAALSKLERAGGDMIVTNRAASSVPAPSAHGSAMGRAGTGHGASAGGPTSARHERRP